MPGLETQFKRRGNRMSLLGTARFCPRSAELSAKYGVGRAAEMSRCFHAKLAQEPGYRAALARLTESERLEIATWQAPGDIVTMDGDERVVLDQASAEREVLLGLDEEGRYMDPTKGDVFLRGFMDFGWVREVAGRKIAYVCDMKRSEWTTVDGPDDLQVVAYGFAFAEMRQCDAFCTAIWAAKEATWSWGELVELDGPKAPALWRAVVAAGQNTSGGAVTGSHCRGCYARLHCPEHLMPAALGSSALAPLTEGGELTSESALRLLQHIKAFEDALELAGETIKAAVNRGLEIYDPKTGKAYRMTQCRGRESVDSDALRAAIGEETFGRFVKRGRPYQRAAWVKR